MQVGRQALSGLLLLNTDNAPSGGEGVVYRVASDGTRMAKIYHKPPTDDHVHKLTYMITHPPNDPMAAEGYTSIAWPTDLLEVEGKVVGFCMPRVIQTDPFSTFYHPQARQAKYPKFTLQYRLRTARNLATAIAAVHLGGYVIGDLNESNVLVRYAAPVALVTLIDTDSFQVAAPHGNPVYRCPVGKPEYTPPELQGVDFRKIDRSVEHDCFGLAVLLFQLLMEGWHPFAGVAQQPSHDGTVAEPIRLGHFPYCRGKQVPRTPPPRAPRWETLYPELQALFLRCFEDGHETPTVRPTAEQWQKALKQAEDALTTCPTDPQHLYSNHLPGCPWCPPSTQQGLRSPESPAPGPEGTTLPATPASVPGSPSGARPRGWSRYGALAGVLGSVLLVGVTLGVVGLQGFSWWRQREPVDRPPVLLFQPAPAQCRTPPCLEGLVTLAIDVQIDGTVDVNVLTTSGSVALDLAAREAAQQRRYTPAQRQGHAVAARVVEQVPWRTAHSASPFPKPGELSHELKQKMIP